MRLRSADQLCYLYAHVTTRPCRYSCDRGRVATGGTCRVTAPAAARASEPFVLPPTRIYAVELVQNDTKSDYSISNP